MGKNSYTKINSANAPNNIIKKFLSSHNDIIYNYTYYSAVAHRQSLGFSGFDKIGAHNHSLYWTETWANYLSNIHFGGASVMGGTNWLVQNISQSVLEFLNKTWAQQIFK